MVPPRPSHIAPSGLPVRTKGSRCLVGAWVTGVASFVLLADISDQRLWTLHLNFERGDQRVFRVNDNVSRFPLNFKTNRKLHLAFSRFRKKIP